MNIIFNYTDEGEYIGQSVAELDPIEGLPMIPRNATTIAPPPAVAGSVRVFGAGAWSQVVDNRGAWYLPSGQSVQLDKLADAVPAGATRNAPVLPPPVPVLTPRQARLALNAAGLRAAVENAIAAAPQDVKDTWQYATEVRRDDAVLLAMAAQIGITAAQLDQLFTTGAAL
ncbi:MAG TPA: hypothetical protein VIU93_02605 [Gallionellaceae bacterium]